MYVFANVRTRYTIIVKLAYTRGSKTQYNILKLHASIESDVYCFARVLTIRAVELYNINRARSNSRNATIRLGTQVEWKSVHF